MMRAKMQVLSVSVPYAGAEEVSLVCVCGSDPFGPNGESEDNSFARYTPSGSATFTLSNPELSGNHKTGDKFYVDFTPAD
jgi:hypothetical protein